MFRTTKDTKSTKAFQDSSLNLLFRVLRDLRGLISVSLYHNFFKTVFCHAFKNKAIPISKARLTMAKVFARSVDTTPKSVGNWLEL